MPIGFSSPARNLFLLGGSGEGIVTNFFRAIARNNNESTIQVTSNQYVDTTKTFYTGGDNRYLSSAPVGSANRRYGFVEERDVDGILGNKVEVAPTTTNTDLDLTDFIVDSSDNIVACGFTPDTGWISKYDSDGAVVWSSTSNTGDAKYRAVAEASDGSYYICGTIQGDFENDEVNTRSIIEKFDSDGNPLWGKQISIADGFVISRGIALNSNNEIYVCGYVEDDTIKASLVKLSETGEIIWDRTFESHDPGIGVLGGYKAAGFYDITIDGKDQIFLVGSLLGTGAVEDGIIVKLNPQGNIEWQKQTTGEDVRYQRVKSDSETGQSVVTGIIQHDTLGECGIVTKYSANGTVVFRRILRASEANSPTNAFDKMALDADPSYYYLAFTDRGYSSSGAPDNDRYIYGRVSTSGNGLGDFEYEFDGNNRKIDYVIDTFEDRIGRLDDGSVRNDTSDLVTYPFGANDLMFDDYATSISNKKAQISEPNIYSYSGSPSVRTLDIQSELNLLGDTGTTGAVAATYNNIDPNNGQSYSMGTQRENDFRSQVVVGNLIGFTRIDIDTNFSWSGSNGGSLSQSTYLRDNSNNIVGFSSGGGLSGGYSFVVTELDPNETYNIYHTSTSSNSSGFAEINASGTITWDGFETLAGTDGAWLDQSGKGNNAVVPYPQPGASGPTANAAGYWEFDGADDAISINSLPAFENITVEWWGTSDYPDTNYRVPVTKATDFFWQDGFGFYQQGSVVSWWVNSWNGGGVTETQSTTQAFGWTHWVGTYDGSDVKLYRNGVLEHSVSFADPLSNPNVSCDIGHSNDGSHWDGNIGEVRIYPIALTPAQVFQNYNATKTKYTNEAPDTAPKIGPGIVYGSNLLLNYDFGNRACYDRTNQNLVPYSQGDGWVSNWTNDGATILSTTERSPVGTNDAVKFTGTGFSTNVSMTSGKTYAWSLYVKVVDAAGDNIKVGHSASQYGSSGNFSANIRYNLSDWSKEYQASGDASYIYDVVSVGDGWYRIGGKAYKGDTNQGKFEIYTDNNATVIIWGPQLEEWENLAAFGSLPPKASRYFGTTGTTVNNVPTTVKNLSSSSYTNTLPTEWVFDINSFQANTGVLVCDPVIPHQTSNTTGYAWEVWVKINSFGLASEAYVFRAYASGDSVTAGAYFMQSGSLAGKLFLQASNNTSSGPNNLAMPDGISEGVWSHFVVTGTHNGIYYQYYNGNAVGAYAANANFVPQQIARIGSGGSTDMSFGEVRCYDRALSAAEVSQNFNATRAKYGV